jgi:hypothetical protein
MNMYHTYRLLGIVCGILAGVVFAYTIAEWPQLEMSKIVAGLSSQQCSCVAVRRAMRRLRRKGRDADAYGRK